MNNNHETYNYSPELVQTHYEKVLDVFRRTLVDNFWSDKDIEITIKQEDTRPTLEALVSAIDDQQLSVEDRTIVEQAKKDLNIEVSQPVHWDELREEYKDDEEKLGALDALQAGLDIAGFEPTIGSFADGANAIIYAMRSAKSLLTGKWNQAKEHLLDAGISAVSLIPFADVIKILRLRKIPKLAKTGIKWARGLKSYAKTEKVKRVQEKTGYEHKIAA